MTDHEGRIREAGLDDREAEIYRLRVVNRLTFAEIGRRLDPQISMQRVAQIYAALQPRLPKVDLEAIRQQSRELHERVQRAALALAEMEGTPVTAGKDGDVVHDPESGAVVRDYAGRVTALKLALEADREIRKLYGADAATKSEVSGSVDYRLIGVDVDALK